MQRSASGIARGSGLRLEVRAEPAPRCGLVATAAACCGAGRPSLAHPKLDPLARLEDAWERLESEIERAAELANGLSFHQLWGRFVDAVHRTRPRGKRAHSHAPKVMPPLTLIRIHAGCAGA